MQALSDSDEGLASPDTLSGATLAFLRCTVNCPRSRLVFRLSRVGDRSRAKAMRDYVSEVADASQTHAPEVVVWWDQGLGIPWSLLGCRRLVPPGGLVDQDWGWETWSVASPGPQDVCHSASVAVFKDRRELLDAHVVLCHLLYVCTLVISSLFLAMEALLRDLCSRKSMKAPLWRSASAVVSECIPDVRQCRLSVSSASAHEEGHSLSSLLTNVFIRDICTNGCGKGITERTVVQFVAVQFLVDVLAPQGPVHTDTDDQILDVSFFQFEQEIVLTVQSISTGARAESNGRTDRFRAPFSSFQEVSLARRENALQSAFLSKLTQCQFSIYIYIKIFIFVELVRLTPREHVQRRIFERSLHVSVPQKC